MKNRRGIWICLVLAFQFLAGSTPGVAQSLRDKVEALQKQYSGMSGLHLLMDIKVFAHEKEEQPYYNQTADVRKKGDSYFYRFGSTEMLMNERFLIIVDKSAKEVMLRRRSVNDEKKIFHRLWMIDLDSILALYKDHVFVGHESRGEHYRLPEKNGVIKQIDIFLDKSEPRLNAIEYRYEDDHFVTIQFTKFDTNPTFADDVFSESRYMVIENGKMRLLNAWKGYALTGADN